MTVAWGRREWESGYVGWFGFDGSGWYPVSAYGVGLRLVLPVVACVGGGSGCAVVRPAWSRVPRVSRGDRGGRFGGVVMTAARDRFRLVREDSGGVLMVDRRGRVREWGSWRAAVRALTDAGEDLAEWRFYWFPAGAIGWRAACLARDAGDVFGA